MLHFYATYPTTIKRQYLLKLNRNDLLVFYVGLMPYENNVYDTSLYLIGYFTIDRVVGFNHLKTEQVALCCEEFANNSHIHRDNRYHNLVIATGEKTKSRLLRRAVKISEKKQHYDDIVLFSATQNKRLVS